VETGRIRETERTKTKGEEGKGKRQREEDANEGRRTQKAYRFGLSIAEPLAATPSARIRWVAFAAEDPLRFPADSNHLLDTAGGYGWCLACFEWVLLLLDLLVAVDYYS
jgi:hypothetical protein